MQSPSAMDTRRQVLQKLGASAQAEQDLLLYNSTTFDTSADRFPAALPLPSEAHIKTWKRYLDETSDRGLYRVLRDRLVQLQFPIEKGISSSDAYRAATRRGILPRKSAGGLVLQQPEQLRLDIQTSLAGEIPVLVARNRNDFVVLVRALTARNEPVPVPDSMGACTVRGYNNWDRIAEYRRKWAAGAGSQADQDWPEEFDRLAEKKELYQDRFIILSDGPYSNVPASELGFSEEDWRKASLGIRLAHECAHYFTERVFGSMKNALHDELIADYAGIVEAAGQFNKAWLVRFLGLENFPAYRPDGRLENYRGNPPLSDEAFRILCRLVRNAAGNIEYFDGHIGCSGPDLHGKCARLFALASLTVEELADSAGGERLLAAYRRYAV
ncbi:MAG: hypothetical protein PHR77_05050 [Kiritimatiellae bacterium]|nr:hypothetical protein [Kiritimatiellia bacterium]MDD5521990.1 hypothetical protein [Kiritimatiellia bacterium]